MRDMKTRFISFFLFMLTMSCFVACSSDDPAPEPEPEPEPEPVETVNTYTYKDKTIQAKSVSCFEQEGIIYVCMSPLQSLETLEDFMSSGKEYVMLGVDKSLVGNPVTVGGSDDDTYVVYYMDADGEAIVTVSPDEWKDVLTQGKITVTMTPGENETSAVKAVFDFELTSRAHIRPSVRIYCVNIIRSQVRHVIESVLHIFTSGNIDFLSDHFGSNSQHQIFGIRYILHRSQAGLRT